MMKRFKIFIILAISEKENSKEKTRLLRKNFRKFKIRPAYLREKIPEENYPKGYHYFAVIYYLFEKNYFAVIEKEKNIIIELCAWSEKFGFVAILSKVE